MERMCSIGGCSRPFKGRGWCEMHLLRWRKYGDTSIVRKKQPKPLEQRKRCAIEGCDELLAGRGWCQKHYMRWVRTGDPNTVRPAHRNYSTPVAGRLHMFEQGDPGECWLWRGATNKNGYGIVGSKGSVVLAHRAVYQELVGPIEAGMTLDHLCANKLCVNPSHLEPCSRRENMFRGGDSHFDLRGKAAHYD